MVYCLKIHYSQHFIKCKCFPLLVKPFFLTKKACFHFPINKKGKREEKRERGKEGKREKKRGRKGGREKWGKGGDRQ